MFGFLRPVVGMALLACLYLAVAVRVEVLAAKQQGDVVNSIQMLAQGHSGGGGFFAWLQSPESNAVMIRHSVGFLAIYTALMLILRYLRDVTNNKLTMQMVYYMREAVYDKLQHVGFSFHDTVSTGQLINRALTDLQNVRVFINSAVLTTLEIVLILIGYIHLILTRNPWLALLAIIPLPFWTWYILKFSRAVQPAAKAAMVSEDRNVALITENISGVHVIKAFATQQQEMEKYGRNCDIFYRRILRRIRLWANFTPIIRSIASASHLSLFLVAGILMVKRKLLVGDFMILGAAMGAILGRLQAVATINEQYQNAIVSARRLWEVMAVSSTVPQKPDAKELAPGRGQLVFENVSFGYDPAKPVLQNVSFTVSGGSMVAIVGPTGSGKTTLVNLIARFYDPQSGTIRIDGQDVRDVKLAALRSQVAFVFQETYLFSDTVEANIAYGRPHIHGGEVEAAARLAQAHEFIETLPLGYQTMLGERGASLSGGQRQRLAIARAILFDPRILVLDDATAAVDPQTEKLIVRGLELVLQERTTFLIAHRISTAQKADMVIVLEHGKVTQIGRHRELMQRPGYYRDVALAQLADQPPEAPSHMDRVNDQRRAAV